MINESGKVAHYSKLKNLANILHDQKIKLGAVENLADPRECSLSWIETGGIGSHTDSSQWLEARKIINDIGKQLKIFCTAGEKEKPESSCPIEASIYGRPRMWSQYGDNSKGFCIILNKKQLSKEIEKLVECQEHLLCDKVNYYEWLHFVNGGVTIQISNEVNLSKLDVFEMINKGSMLDSIFFKKSKDWEGEEEYRWLIYSKNKGDIYIPIKKSVEAVVLGWKFPSNQFSQVKAYCENLECHCYVLDYQHPKYEFVRLT